MKITIEPGKNGELSSAASNLWNGKGECLDTLTVFGIENGKIKKLVSAGFYATRNVSASPKKIYCIFEAKDRTGSGYAGGCGYNKKSHAFGEACHNAGIFLENESTGEGMVKEALFSIARDLYPNIDTATMVIADNNPMGSMNTTKFFLKEKNMTDTKSEQEYPEMG